MQCNTLKLIEMRDFGERKTEYIRRMKEYFNTNIKNKTFIFKGLNVKVLFFDDEDEDRAWRKFSIGDEKGHNYTSKIDIRRLPYLPLITYIMENIDKCWICDKFAVEEIDGGRRYRILFKCFKNWYKIVLSKNSDQDFYYLISAYVDNRLSK